MSHDDPTSDEPTTAPSPEETAAAFADAMRSDQFRRELRTEVRDRDTVVMHLWVYGAVNALLVALWALLWSAGGESTPWFLVPLVGWGIVLAAHALNARRGRT